MRIVIDHNKRNQYEIVIDHNDETYNRSLKPFVLMKAIEFK